MMKSSAGSREAWCASLPDRSLPTLRDAANRLTIEQLRPHGYDYCYLNLLTVFGGRYPTPQLSSMAAACIRNYLFSGEEFHTYCLAAQGKRPWDSEVQALDAGLHLTARAERTMRKLLAKGSVVACGFHWGPFRFTPFALNSLGFTVTSMLSAVTSDSYASYTSYSDAEIAEMRARGVSEQFYGAKVVDTNKPELLSSLKSLKNTPGVLYIPVDGMFTSRPARHSVEISFAGSSLQVKSNPARLAASLAAPLVAILAVRETSMRTAIDVADVVEPTPGGTFAQTAMQRMYQSLETCVMESPEQWAGARTFHHLRKLPPSEQRAMPSPEDLSAVRAAIEREQLSFQESRVACMQMADGGQAWVDSQTLRCFGRSPETVKILAAIQKRTDVAALWQEFQRDEERSNSLIYFLGQLRAEGLLSVGM